MAAALAVTLFAGFVKGAVGFAMPMILVSAFAVFLPQDLALAGTDPADAGDEPFAGVPAGGRVRRVETARTYRRFLIGDRDLHRDLGPVCRCDPSRMVYLLMLGVPISIFAALQLCGPEPSRSSAGSP